MSEFKEILVPTDFSAASAYALEYACSLADRVGASLVVLHVFDPCPVHDSDEECFLPQEFVERAERHARSCLERLLNAEETARFRARLVLRAGQPTAAQILVYLEEHPTIDLVVMATHGRGGVSRLVMGGVADKIVRASPCPVLTMRAPAAKQENAGPAA